MSDIIPEPGYVYVWGGDGIYKIGKAKDVRRRLAYITLPPFPCELVHVIATDDSYKLESLLHWKFAAQRKNGEWFALSDNDIAYLQSLDPEQEFACARQRQRVMTQHDPDIVELEQHKIALQKEIVELRTRRERVQAEADEQDRWWAMITLRTRDAEQELNQLLARIAEAEAKQPRPNWWQRLWGQ